MACCTHTQHLRIFRFTTTITGIREKGQRRDATAITAARAVDVILDQSEHLAIRYARIL